ncbi:MAG: ABC transporter permease [Reyranella sp.]|jgi:ABC-type spermidine/putrescine transport system permease subunit I|uniref:ABC transporter permease n=1 Tax=Reyranella sp. TaxID=1929291 RepID=UPI0025F9CB5F|nr:ABC transporter permease [Reyranella sp.]MBR2818342.1 ABC transporter permease [Reyranella sp.]
MTAHADTLAQTRQFAGGRRNIAGPSADTLRVWPLLILLIALFDLPLLFTLGLSLYGKNGFTLAHYAELLNTPAYLGVMASTLRVSLIATLVNALVGYPLAYWITGLDPRRRGIALACVLLPFWVSILVRTYAWIVVLGNGGLVNRLLQWGGVVDEPISFLYSEVGVTIGMTNVLLPFLVLPLYAAMMRIDGRLTQAASSLGASSWTVFWRVFFPLTAPTLAASALLVFMLSLGFYVTPAILGGGKVAMAGNLLDSLINQIPRWEMAAALAAVLLVITLAIYFAYARLGRWSRA